VGLKRNIPLHKEPRLEKRAFLGRGSSGPSVKPRKKKIPLTFEGKKKRGRRRKSAMGIGTKLKGEGETRSA